MCSEVKEFLRSFSSQFTLNSQKAFNLRSSDNLFWSLRTSKRKGRKRKRKGLTTFYPRRPTKEKKLLKLLKNSRQIVFGQLQKLTNIQDKNHFLRKKLPTKRKKKVFLLQKNWIILRSKLSNIYGIYLE
jgi:hypothetical protein